MTLLRRSICGTPSATRLAALTGKDYRRTTIVLDRRALVLHRRSVTDSL